MIATKCSKTDLELALAAVNIKYADNIEFRRLDAISGTGQRWRFTLKVISSKGPGHGLGNCRTTKGNRRRIPAACWHVHGDFFDALIEINENARIFTAGRWVDKDGGNWQDWNAGSMIDPMSASGKCECRGEQKTNQAPARHYERPGPAAGRT